MATQMLNFGGNVSASVVSEGNGSKVIPTAGTADSEFQIRSVRQEGSTIIIFSMVLNNKHESETLLVDIWMANNNNLQQSELISVGKSIAVVPGRPISLDYKVNLTQNNSLYVTASKPGYIDIVISAVQM